MSEKLVIKRVGGTVGKSSWTIADESGKFVFEETRNGHRHLTTWKLKREASTIIELCYLYGVDYVREKLKRKKTYG